MTAYIHRHYRKKIKLDEIAAAGNVCRSSCHALFRTYLSRTPMEYLTEYRLRQSLDSLLHSALPISEIGNSIGGTASGLAAPVIIPNCFGNISTVPPGITGEAAEPKNPLSAYKQHKFLLSIFISRDYNKIRIYFEGSVRI